MRCVIKNRKDVYIRLNHNGSPVTCTDSEKTFFEESKANNILKSLPRNLKRLKFKIEIVPDSIKCEQQCEGESLEVIKNDNYIIPETIYKWVEKFGICDDILKEAKTRKHELNKIISNCDKTISNLLHKIELENSKNAYEGYLLYRQLKEIVDERRKFKDEFTIINNIVRMDFRKLDRENVHRAVAGLAKRQFTYRIIEEVNQDDVL